MVDPSRPTPRSGRRGDPRFEDRLEGRLDQWMAAGRQLVDGVAGARPGSRASARGAGSRAGSVPRLDGLGRWVENRLDWLLEDEDNWREPWERQGQVPPPDDNTPRASRPAARPAARQPLEAISRRVTPQLAPSSDDWPADDNFSLNRWRRDRPPTPDPGTSPVTGPSQEPPSPGAGRTLPRSTRRR